MAAAVRPMALVLAGGARRMQLLLRGVAQLEGVAADGLVWLRRHAEAEADAAAQGQRCTGPAACHALFTSGGPGCIVTTNTAIAAAAAPRRRAVALVDYIARRLPRRPCPGWAATAACGGGTLDARVHVVWVACSTAADVIEAQVLAAARIVAAVIMRVPIVVAIVDSPLGRPASWRRCHVARPRLLLPPLLLRLQR